MTDFVEFRNTSDVLSRWLKRSRESQLSHHLMCERLEARHTLLGFSVISITSIVGATTIATDISKCWQIILGLLTLLATILTALQTFLKLEDRANRHRIAAAGYAQVRRNLELANTLSAEEMENRVKDAELALNSLAHESPSVSKSIYDKAMKRGN